jgi:hypothetical protein
MAERVGLNLRIYGTDFHFEPTVVRLEARSGAVEEPNLCVGLADHSVWLRLVSWRAHYRTQ